MTAVIRRALESDVPAIHDIITIAAEKSGILKRSPEDIRESINTFLVAEIDDLMVGVISFYPYGQELKEVRSLAVSKDYSRHGIGTGLLVELIRMVREEGGGRIFALSSLPVFFQKNGFRIVDRASLPEKIWKDCDRCPKKDSCQSIALEFIP